MEQIKHSTDTTAEWLEHSQDDSIPAKRVKNYVWTGSSWIRQSSGDGTTIERYDYSSPTTIYVGSASPGTAASAAAWTIYKYNLSDTSDASALRATNTAWTNRASGSYS